MTPDEREQFHLKFAEALNLACRLHAQQTCAHSNVPYISHLIGVASLVLEQGGSEHEAVAAVLHHAMEHPGPEYRREIEGLREEIRQRFGSDVLSLIEACSEPSTDVSTPWRRRKQEYIDRLTSAIPSALAVSCADKLHEARAILSDLRVMGDKLWDRFRGGRTDALWYYRALVGTFRQAATNALVNELDRVVSDIEELAASNDGDIGLGHEFNITEQVDRVFDDSSRPADEPLFVLLVGGICAGKTTLRKERFSRGYVLLDAGEIFLNLNPGEDIDFPGVLQAPMEMIGRSIARRAVRERRNIVTEVIGNKAESIKAVMAAMESLGYRVELVGVTCEVEEALRRNDERGNDNISAYYTQEYHQRWLFDAAKESAALGA